MEKKLSIALLFGGRSTEHEVSLTSASYVLEKIDKTRFDVLPVLLSRDGQWFLIEDMESFLAKRKKLIAEFDPQEAHLRPVLLDYTRGGKLLDLSNLAEIAQIDVLFPILHGPYGEDGTIQGLAKMANIACVGGGIIGSAAGLDKVIMKNLFHEAGLPILPLLSFTRSAWEEEKDKIVATIEKKLTFPVFVKPASSGSSVGVTKVKEKKDLDAAVREAARFDRKIIVEQGLEKPRELECGILGNEAPEASPVGEVVIPEGGVYSYEEKYLKGAAQTVVPADVDYKTMRLIQKMSRQAFLAVDCSGFARVDFLMDVASKKVYVNEINTIPGFTAISMYPKLWEAAGISYSSLITRLIELARARFNEEKCEVKV